MNNSGDDQAPECRDVSAILGRIAKGRKFDRGRRELWREWRGYAETGRKPGSDEWLIDTNLIEATIEGLLPHLYARNPEVSAQPSEAVRPSQVKEARDFGRTAEIVVTRLLVDAGLKQKIKRLCRATMTTGIGWLKLSLHGYTDREPIAPHGRPDDARDQVDFVMRLRAALADPETGVDDRERMEAELAKAEAALAEQPEADVMQGAALDVVSCDDLQLPADLAESADYLDADWIAHRVWMGPEKVAETFRLSPEDMKCATKYLSRGDVGDSDGQSRSNEQASDDGWMAVWEVWDRRSRTVCTVIEGVKRYASPPQAPRPSTLRFYPFHRLSFHDSTSARWPMSDVYMWAKLQDEYCRARSAWADMRQRSRPARIGAAGIITPEDARKIADPSNNELVLVNTPSGTNVQALIGQLEPARMDPAIYETNTIRADLDQVSGLQDAARGAVVQPKTATEAEILQTGMMTRVGERQDVIEDMIGEMAQAALQMALQAMQRADVVRYAGQAAIWPQLDIRDIHQLLTLSVRGGSSGRQSRQREQQSWGVLLPILMQGVTEVFMLRAQGQTVLADAKAELLRETLRRADERIDLDQILPPVVAAPPAVDPMTGMPAPAGMPMGDPLAAMPMDPAMPAMPATPPEMTSV